MMFTKYMKALPLDLACHHQPASTHKPCPNVMELFILRPDMKRSRTTRPVIALITSEWPAVSESLAKQTDCSL